MDRGAVGKIWWMKHRYALMNRPAGLGALPKGIEFEVLARPGPGLPHHDTARHGVLVTNRPLSNEEVVGFELPELVDGQGLAQLAELVASGSMGRYAGGYVAMAEEDGEAFMGCLVEGVKRATKDRPVSVGDWGGLRMAALSELRIRAGERCACE